MFTAKIDRVNKTITVSRNDLIAAGQFGTPEFEQMMRMRTEFPGYTIVEHHIKRNADKQTYGKLTYDVMEGFIESHATDAQKCAALLKEYETIQSSRFLTETKTQELVEGLRTLCSKHQARALHRDVIVTNRVKNMNESIHRSVEFLTTSIEKGVQIRFKYFDYDVKQERVYRKKGGFYTISPYNLIYSDDNYYLLAYDPELAQFRTYRVDRMAYLGLTDKPREGQEALEALNMENYQKQTFSMYGGDVKHVTLRVSNRMMGAIIDKFGRQNYAHPVDDRHFEVTVSVAISPQFYGWVFGLKNYVTIVSPQDVVEGMKEHLRAVMKRYE